MLDTIARELTPETTLGDIVDAAQDLGWGDSLGELRLADLAGALLGEAPPAPPRTSTSADDQADTDLVADANEADDGDEHAAEQDEDEQDEQAEQDEEEALAPVAEPPKTARARKTAAKAAAKAAARVEPPRKPSSLDRALDRIDKALAARGRKGKTSAAAKSKPSPAAAKKPALAAKKPAAPVAAAKKTPSKKAPVVVREDEDEDDDNDAMSLEQAAKVLVPLVRKLKEATMQDLEEQTGMGRRKLRFHIGQLVKHGRLKRHGMGRGTCYTVK